MCVMLLAALVIEKVCAFPMVMGSVLTEKEEAGIFSLNAQVDVPTVAVPFLVVIRIVPEPEELLAGTYAASAAVFPFVVEKTNDVPYDELSSAV